MVFFCVPNALVDFSIFYYINSYKSRNKSGIMELRTNSNRKAIKDKSIDVLYEDDRYLITVAKCSENSHHLLVNDVYSFLDRGILHDCARAKNQGRLRRILENAVSGGILYEIDKKQIPLDELGWVLARAVITEKDRYIPLPSLNES